MFYGAEAFFDDDETQRRGTIYVLLSFGERMTSKLEFKQNSPNTNISCLPLRTNAMHFCSDNPKLKALQAFQDIILGFMEKSLRARFRVHCGEYQRQEGAYEQVNFV